MRVLVYIVFYYYCTTGMWGPFLSKDFLSNFKTLERTRYRLYFGGPDCGWVGLGLIIHFRDSGRRNNTRCQVFVNL